jgi:hypothetical protein
MKLGLAMTDLREAADDTHRHVLELRRAYIITPSRDLISRS